MGEIQYETPRLHRLAAATGELKALDAPAKRVAKIVRSVLPGGPVKDALSGTFLGHPVHPLLTDVPIGTWTSAVMLDWIGGSDSRTGSPERTFPSGFAAFFSADCPRSGLRTLRMRRRTGEFVTTGESF